AGRNRDFEYRSLTEAAGDIDHPAVQLYQLVDESKANARPFLTAAGLAFDTVKALEQPWQLLLGNTHPGVPHGQNRPVACRVERDADGDLAFEGELEGIREKVENDVLPHAPIDMNRYGERRAIDD